MVRRSGSPIQRKESGFPARVNPARPCVGRSAELYSTAPHWGPTHRGIHGRLARDGPSSVPPDHFTGYWNRFVAQEKQRDPCDFFSLDEIAFYGLFVRDEGTNLVVRLGAGTHRRAHQPRRNDIDTNSKWRVVRGGRQTHRLDRAFTGRVCMSREEFPLRKTR